MILLTVSDRVRIWQGLVKFDFNNGVFVDERERVVANTGENGISAGNSGQMKGPGDN